MPQNNNRTIWIISSNSFTKIPCLICANLLVIRNKCCWTKLTTLSPCISSSPSSRASPDRSPINIQGTAIRLYFSVFFSSLFRRLCWKQLESCLAYHLYSYLVNKKSWGIDEPTKSKKFFHYSIYLVFKRGGRTGT